MAGALRTYWKTSTGEFKGYAPPTLGNFDRYACSVDIPLVGPVQLLDWNTKRSSAFEITAAGFPFSQSVPRTPLLGALGAGPLQNPPILAP